MTIGTTHIPLEFLRQVPLSAAYLSNHTYNYEAYMPEKVKTYFTQIVCRGALKATFKYGLTDHHRSNLPTDRKRELCRCHVRNMSWG